MKNKRIKSKFKKDKGAGKDNRRVIKNAIIKVFDIPKEVVLNLPLISLVSNEEVTVENYKNIIEYNDGILRLSVPTGILTICGRGLYIKQITDEYMQISGIVSKIEFS